MISLKALDVARWGRYPGAHFVMEKWRKKILKADASLFRARNSDIPHGKPFLVQNLENKAYNN